MKLRVKWSLTQNPWVHNQSRFIWKWNKSECSLSVQPHISLAGPRDSTKETLFHWAQTPLLIAQEQCWGNTLLLSPLCQSPETLLTEHSATEPKYPTSSVNSPTFLYLKLVFCVFFQEKKSPGDWEGRLKVPNFMIEDWSAPLRPWASTVPQHFSIQRTMLRPTSSNNRPGRKKRFLPAMCLPLLWYLFC